METKRIKIAKFTYLLFSGDYRNCKFSTFDQIQTCLKVNEKKTIKAIKEEIKYEVSWFVTLNDIKYVEILKKEFEPIYIQQIPLGYSGGYQYHCLFFGYSNDTIQYLDRLEKEPDKSQLISDKNLNKILNYKSKAWLKKFLIKYI